MVTHLNEIEFIAREIEKETCFIDFYATWCPPCQMLAPVLEKVSENYTGSMNFYKINIDENPNIAHKFQVTHVPTLITLKNGAIADKAVGFLDEQKLSDFIDNTLSTE